MKWILVWLLLVVAATDALVVSIGAGSLVGIILAGLFFMLSFMVFIAQIVLYIIHGKAIR